MSTSYKWQALFPTDPMLQIWTREYGSYVIGCSDRNTSQAFPDVAAQGDFFRVIIGGIPQLIGGTSAATPVFSAVIALLNDVRLKNGKPPLGFLNPLIYKTMWGFNEITVGNNAGCGTTGFKVSTMFCFVSFFTPRSFFHVGDGWMEPR